MKTVPNQKVVTIASRVKRDKDHLYLMANIDALSEAIKKLNGSGLKMWLYLNKNQDNYKFALSQKDAQDFGIKKDSYYKGIEELIAKGYLCQSCEGSNHFYFCESPRTEPFYGIIYEWTKNRPHCVHKGTNEAKNIHFSKDLRGLFRYPRA